MYNNHPTSGGAAGSPVSPLPSAYQAFAGAGVRVGVRVKPS